MDDEALAHRRAVATAIAHEAGALALRYFLGREHLAIEEKGAQDLVSEADRAVESLVRERLLSLFPGDGIIGEEHDEHEAKGEAGSWVIDPIDGTWCFLNGIRSWCVSIAYVRQGSTLVGVIYDPCSNEMFTSHKGGGATLDGRGIEVADARSLEDGTTSAGFSPRSTADAMIPVLDGLIRKGGLYHRHGSGALALAWTACGRLIAYVEPHMQSWDCLAGLLLIEEAGGFTNDFLARNGLYAGNAVVAGAPALEPVLRELTRHWS